MGKKWIYLSYELSDTHTNYGGAKGIVIEWIRNMSKGDTSNNSHISLPSHSGTHIDYPLHFVLNGKTGSHYSAEDLSFSNIGVLDIQKIEPTDFLITKEHLLEVEKINPNIDFLIIKTGFCYQRNSEKYWKYNWGLAPETADYLTTNFKKLRAIGFDLISLSAYQQREIGRQAHKDYLEKNNLLIIEDMDLREIENQNIEQLIISPLRFLGADGSPVNVHALIQ